MTAHATIRRCAAALGALLLAACQGEGSEIGPALGEKPEEPFQVQVFDDASRPVCGAVATFSGATAVTGRAGRAESEFRPGAAGVCVIDPGAASAIDGDDLQRLVVAAAPVDGGRGLGRALYLPDVSTSLGLNVVAGVQPTAVVLDDVATGGGVLVVPAGADVSNAGQPTVTLRTGKLEPRHLPLAAPVASGFAALVSRAILVSPTSATFGPGVLLAMPDDLNAAAGSTAPIELFRLDEGSGTWVRAGNGEATPGRITSTFPGIDRGGLYVFAVPTPRVATVIGRVVDRVGRPLGSVHVHAGGLATTTAADGTFSLGPLPAFDPAGNARDEKIELVGGRGLLPVASTELVTLTDGPVPIGDRILDTVASAHVRFLLVERGSLLPDRRVRTSEAFGESFADAYVGDDGISTFEDVAVGFYGVIFGRTVDVQDGFRTEGLLRVRPSDRIVDARFFSLRNTYDERRRGNNVQVFDVVGGGPVQDAAVVRGVEPEKGFVGRTFEGGAVFLGLGRDDQITAVSDRTRDGRRVISAFTTVATAAHRIELPLRTPLRARVGAFDRFGLVAGRVTGGTAGRARELRVGFPLRYRDWFERVMLDATAGGGSAPVESAPTLDPEIRFTAGVPRPLGHVALIETRPEIIGEVVAGAFLAFDVDAPQARTTALEGALLPCDTTFSALSVGGGRDPRIAGLVADWGAANARGSIADAARGTVPVETMLMGSTVRVDLPALAGVLAGGSHFVCIRGAADVGDLSLEQRQVVALRQVNGNTAAPMLAVPALLEPGLGATVSPDGFAVSFTLPADASFATLRLVSERSDELREWRVLLPPYVTTFSFRRLPPEAAAVLEAGRTWRLELTAYRVTHDPLFGAPDIYTTVISNFVTLGPAGLGVDAIARVSISLVTP